MKKKQIKIGTTFGMLVFLCMVTSSCKKEIVNHDKTSLSSDSQDLATRAYYNAELAKEFSNVVLKARSDSHSDTTNILNFMSLEEFKIYLRKNPLVEINGKPVISQATRIKTNNKSLNIIKPAVIKPLNLTLSTNSYGSYIASWSQTVPIQDYPGFSIGLSAIVGYSATYSSTKWYKQITSVGSLAASGGQDVTVGIPGASGSTRIRITTTGISSNIIYQGYSAQVTANIAITETKTVRIAGNQSTVETTTIRSALGTINSQALPDPPPVD